MNDALLEKVLKSFFFKKATDKAGKYVSGGLVLLELLREVLVKVKEVADKEQKGVGVLLSEKLMLLVRMAKSYASGQYKIVPWTTMIKIVAVLIYFVSPFDFIPDILPLIGLSDDLALVMWLLSSLHEDIANFEAWEKGKLLNEAEAWLPK